MRRYLKPPPLAKGKVTRKDRKILSEADARKLAAVREPVGTGPAELIRHFLANRAPTTVKAYRADLDAFAEFLGKPSEEEAVAELISSGAAHANLLCVRWLGQLRADNLASSTRARRISTLRSLTQLGRMIGFIDWEIEVRRPRFQPRERAIPQFEELQLLLGACKEGLLGTRDRALLLLVLTMCLRRSEIASLRFQDYQRDQGRLFVRGKGGRTNWMHIPPDVRSALDEWICLSRGRYCSARSAGSAVAGECPIFVRLDRGDISSAPPMTPDGIYVVVRRIGARAGMRICPDDLHTAAISLALEATNGDIRSVQRLGRYADPTPVLRINDRFRDDAGTIANAVARLTTGSDDE